MKPDLSKPIEKWDLIPFGSEGYPSWVLARAKDSYGLIDPKKVRQIEELKLMRKGS